MKVAVTSRLTMAGSPRLILFFAGWGMDPHPFEGLERDGYDIAVVCDYADPAPLPDSLLSGYDEICVVAWSFGVPYAARFITRNSDRLPITRCVAVNGTLTPVDDLTGIPRAIFDGTLAGLNERTLHKFNRRMTGGGEAFARFANRMPERSMESLADELRQVDADGSAPDPIFDAVYISGADRIIPAENQRRGWAGHHNIINLGDDASHMPDFATIMEREMADKRLIGRSFGSAGDTYDAEAAIQRDVASHLASLWHDTRRTDGSVVEFGVGTGFLTRMIADRSPMRLYDLAPLTDEVIAADAETAIAAMTDSDTAGVISSSTIQWFNSPLRFIARALRLLPAGAVLALSTFAPDTYHELAPFQKSRPNYVSARQLRQLAESLVAEGVAEADYIVEEGELATLRFDSTRDLVEHTRRSGVNAARLAGVASARALLAAAPVALTYAPVYLIIRRR